MIETGFEPATIRSGVESATVAPPDLIRKENKYKDVIDYIQVGN